MVGTQNAGTVAKLPRTDIHMGEAGHEVLIHLFADQFHDQRLNHDAAAHAGTVGQAEEIIVFSACAVDCFAKQLTLAGLITTIILSCVSM